MFEYKMISVPKNIAVNNGKDLGLALAEYVQNEVNKMSSEVGNFIEQIVIPYQNYQDV